MMVNRYSENRPKDKSLARAARKGAPSAPMPMKTANWHGLPGKTQGKSRGPKSSKFYIKSEGL